MRSRPMPVSTVRFGSSVREPSSAWSNSMKTRFQISIQRSPPHSSWGVQSGRPQEHGPPTSK